MLATRHFTFLDISSCVYYIYPTFQIAPEIFVSDILRAIDLGERLGKLEGRSAATVRFVSVIMVIITSLFFGVGGYLYTTSQKTIEDLTSSNIALEKNILDIQHANTTVNERLDMVILLLLGKAEPFVSLRAP